MPDIRLITLDLDGTLLNSEKQLTEENADALQKASAAGIEIVPATGRFYRGMPEVIRNLPFVHYVISINGAEIYDVANDRVIGGSEIPYEQAISIMEYLDTLPVIYDCYQDGWGWMTKTLYDQAEDFAATVHSLNMIKNLRTPVPDLKARLLEKKAGVQKIQFFFKDMALRAETLRTLPERYPDLAVTTSIVNNVELNNRNATKGIALKKLAKHLHLRLRETMAFGDDLNDVTMLKAAGIGIAMGNASEAAKAAADYVTDDCDRNGVAKALRLFLKF
ncbi:MAG: HAD family phosphatase [Lachnospiraceae bacterium]|nr:HAD family phosphatase [Lachnospiraceae bacterium]